MSENNTILSRIFTQNILKGLVDNESDATSGLHTVVRRYHISYENGKTNEEVISEIYSHLDKNYRNEYYYKNTLINKLIVNAHRMRTTVALTEVPIAKSKADFIMINGKGVVYEIKTELDTFDRLHSQIKDYFKAFDHVCVVTSEDQSKDLLKQLLDSPVGIYVLTKRNTIRRLKEPEKYSAALDIDSIFRVLNKPEYESLVKKLHGSLPDVTPVKYYSECKKIVKQHPVDEVYPLFLAELKKRNRIDISEYKAVPEALHFLVYFAKYKSHDYQRLHQFLCAPFDGS